MSVVRMVGRTGKPSSATLSIDDFLSDFPATICNSIPSVCLKETFDPIPTTLAELLVNVEGAKERKKHRLGKTAVVKAPTFCIG